MNNNNRQPDADDQAITSFSAGNVRPPKQQKASATIGKPAAGKKVKKLSACPVCSQPISRHAHFCPNCGEPDPFYYIGRTTWVSRIFWTIVILVAIWFGYTTLYPMLMNFIKHI